VDFVISNTGPSSSLWTIRKTVNGSGRKRTGTKLRKGAVADVRLPGLHLDAHDKAGRLFGVMAKLDMRVNADILFVHAPEDVLFPIRDEPNVIDARV
jgi:hypothetical protein